MPTFTPVLMESAVAGAEAHAATVVPTVPAERAVWMAKCAMFTEALGQIETAAADDDDVYEFWYANRSRFRALAAAFDEILVRKGAPEA